MTEKGKSGMAEKGKSGATGKGKSRVAKNCRHVHSLVLTAV
jgi:hypothetical protein